MSRTDLKILIIVNVYKCQAAVSIMLATAFFILIGHQAG